MTEITDENFMDLLLGGDDDQDGVEDDDEYGPSASPEPVATSSAALPSAPAPAQPLRDDAARETVDMIEDDIRQAEAALARQLRVRGAFGDARFGPVSVTR
jgi:hypothetical protein